MIFHLVSPDGWAMSQALPTGNLRWVPENDLKELRKNPAAFINAIPEDGDIGYYFEVDLEISEEDHDK
jgi:hypothetical protein